MGHVQLRNRARTLLLVGIDEVQTNLQVINGDAEKLPELIVPDDVFYAAIIDDSNNVEYVKVVERNLNSLTVERGIGGTVARAFSAGSRFELRVIDEAWEGLAQNDWHRLKAADGSLVMPILIDNSSFYVSGDYAGFYPTYRALKVTQTNSGYGHVSSSAFDEVSGRTTVVVEGIVLDAGFSFVEVGGDINAYPKYAHAATADTATSATSATNATNAANAEKFGGKLPADYEPAFVKKDGHNLPISTETEAKAGGINTAVMTPLRTKQVLDEMLSPGVPVGTVMHFAGSTPPEGWLVRDGALKSRTTYAALFAVIGETFGAGDGSTTFALPDDRDLFDRGVPDGGVVGTYQADALGSHRHAFSRKIQDSSTNTGTSVVTGYDTSLYTGYTSTVGEAETRPKNRHYLPIIKY